VLICADGATSKLATQLGIVTTPPSSQCSRAYVEGGTHKFKADGVVFWNSELLPGKLCHWRHLSLECTNSDIVIRVGMFSYAQLY